MGDLQDAGKSHGRWWGGFMDCLQEALVSCIGKALSTKADGGNAYHSGPGQRDRAGPQPL